MGWEIDEILGNGGIMKKPWAVEHRRLLLNCGIGLGICWIFSMWVMFSINASAQPYFLVLPWIAVPPVISIFLVVASLTFKDFDRILDKLGNEIVKAEVHGFINRYTLAFETRNHGKFSLLSVGKSIYGPYYELAVPVTKSTKSINLKQGSSKKENVRVDELVERLKEFGPLEHLKAHGSEWSLRFNCEWFHRKTPDIIKILKILREVERKL